MDKLPFRFTGKELDEETGLHYYGARYLDPKYSRRLSGDPVLNDYIPKAPINDEAKKHNENLPGMGGIYNTVNLHVYHYAGNNPVKYTDPTGMWINNGDGTYTAEKGDTLYGLYGDDWKEKSGFTRDPKTLQVGEIIGQKNEYETLLDPISICPNKNVEKKSFFSNHDVFVSYESNDVANVLYAGAGANFDYKNGNFNLNAKTGVANYEESWKVSDSKRFNFGITGRASGIAGDAMIGLEGSLLGGYADAHVFKGGGSVDITLWGVTFSIGGDVMAGGIGGGLLLGKNGFKASLDIGFGAGFRLTWRKEE